MIISRLCVRIFKFKQFLTFSNTIKIDFQEEKIKKTCFDDY